MATHVVLPGEHLAGVAYKYGFTDPDVIWHRAENKSLLDGGRTPNTLLPGDLLFIPDRTDRVLSRGTDSRCRVSVNISTTRLRIALQAFGGKPVTGAHGSLHIEPDDMAISTDGKGQFEATVLRTAEVAELRLDGDATTLHAIVIPLHIGHLDPVTAISGQEGRLNNLGYRAGIGGSPDAAAFRSAVEEFQCDEHLTVDGVCGPQTQGKLRSVHGC